MKEKTICLKFLVTPGKITPSPPISSTLGQYHINLSEFCLSANNLTKTSNLQKVNLLVYISSPKSYKIRMKTSPVSLLIKIYSINLETIKIKTILNLAKLKKKDLNKNISLISIIKSILGTQKTMKIRIIN